MNTQGIPSCEWPDARRGATFRNCYDKDGRVDNNLREIAAKKRIKEIREHPNAGSGLHEALGRWDGSEGGEPVAASIPVMLTRQMEVDLRRRGFTQAEINRMTPQQANNILAGEAPENAPAAVAVEDTEGEL